MSGTLSNTANNWDWKEKFVDSKANASTSATFASADSTLICVGPPEAQKGSQFNVQKLGAASSFSLSQQIPQNRIAEIGSRRVHFVNGTPVGGGSISRFLYHGPTLLRQSYKLVYDTKEKISIGSEEFFGNPDVAGMWEQMIKNEEAKEIHHAHEKTDFWISCWDTKLRYPIGFAVYFQDSGGRFIGGYYVEGVQYNMHNVGQQASQTLIAESLSFAFTKVVPLATGPGSELN